MTLRLYKIITPLVILSLLVFILPNTAAAAVALDNTATSAATSGTTCNSFSFTLTVNALDNTVIVVGLAVKGNGGSITSATVNSAAMTQDRIDTDAANPQRQTAIYHYKAIATGSNVIAITNTGNTAAAACRAIAISFTGVDPTNPIDVKTGDNNTAVTNPPSCSITPTVTGEQAVDIFSSGQTAMTVGASQTSILNVNDGTASGFGGSYMTSTQSSNFSMTWTGNGTYSHSCVSLEPVQAPPPTPHKFSINGTVFINAKTDFE